MPARKEPARKAPVPRKQQTTKGASKGAVSKAATATAPKRRKTKENEDAYVAAQNGSPRPKKAAATRMTKPTPSKPAQHQQASAHVSTAKMDGNHLLTPDESPFQSPQDGRLASPEYLQALAYEHHQSQQQSYAGLAPAVQHYDNGMKQHPEGMSPHALSPSVQSMHHQVSSPQILQVQASSQRRPPREHPLRGDPNVTPSDVRTWLFERALASRSSQLPNLQSLGNHMNSEHIDAVASAMWEVALASTNGMGDVLWRAAAYSTNLSELKLRTLARMNVLPAWWLFREYAVEKFRSDINWTVDDSAKEMFWKMCLDDTMKHTYARDQLLVKAEQRKAEYAMKQEQEQGDIKAE